MILRFLDEREKPLEGLRAKVYLSGSKTPKKNVKISNKQGFVYWKIKKPGVYRWKMLDNLFPFKMKPENQEYKRIVPKKDRIIVKKNIRISNNHIVSESNLTNRNNVSGKIKLTKGEIKAFQIPVFTQTKLSLRVINREDKSVKGANVELSRRKKYGVKEGPKLLSYQPVVADRTNIQGRFKVTHLKPGWYEVAAGHVTDQNEIFLSEKEFYLKKGVTNDVTLKLKRTDGTEVLFKTQRSKNNQSNRGLLEKATIENRPEKRKDWVKYQDILIENILINKKLKIHGLNRGRFRFTRIKPDDKLKAQKIDSKTEWYDVPGNKTVIINLDKH